MNFLLRHTATLAPEGVGTGGGSEGSPAAASSAPVAAPSSDASSGAAPSPAPSMAPAAAPAPTPAPAAAPSVAAPPTTPPAVGTPPVPAPGGMDDLFTGFDSQLGDEEDFSLPPPVAAPPAPAQAVPPAQGAVPAQPTPAAPAAPPAQAPGPQDFLSPATPGIAAQLMQQNEAALVDHLAQTAFQMTPEDLQALETDAPAHIPKLLARAYVKAQVNLMQQLDRVVPAMIERLSQTATKNSKNEAKFYQRWPAVNQEAHGDLVKRIATIYRQTNPQATLDQMIEDLGPMVMMAANIPLTPQPPAPYAARMTSPPSPFRPAMGGTAAIPPVTPAASPWEGLAPPGVDDE